MRVAALYDIHGNLPALEAVLADVDREGVDLIVIGGDVAAGPYPAETVALLRTRGERVRFVRGNADREVADGGGRIPEPVRAWLSERADPFLRATLRAWPEQVELEVDGLGPTLFCHATARNDEEIFTELTPDDIVAAMFVGAPGVAVVGHTHMQADRRVDGRRIVNAGSVGLPYEGRAGAYWALLGGDVSFRRTEYDVTALVRELRAAGFPTDEFYRESLLEPMSRRAVAEHFEGVAGRAPRKQP